MLSLKSHDIKCMLEFKLVVPKRFVKIVGNVLEFIKIKKELIIVLKSVNK